MDKLVYLKNLKVGDTVTRFFHGAGYITQGEESTVVHIDDHTLWIGEELEESEYSTKSLYAYSINTGSQIQRTFGMFHTIELPGSIAPDASEESIYD